MLEILLTVLSGSAAVGLRIALPLLIIAVYRTDLWSRIPLLSDLSPPIVFGVLSSWTLLELFASKDRLGQRLVGVLALILSPFVGGLLGIAIATITTLPNWQVLTLAIVSGGFSLLLQLLQLGWLYRIQRIPLRIAFLQDFTCVMFTLFVFDAPIPGGLMALLLMGVAMHSAIRWRRWHRAGKPMP